MKTLFALSLAVSSLFFIASCGSNNPTQNHDEDVDMGTFDDHNYTCKEIGWETSYPKGPTITTKEALKSLSERSQKSAGVENVKLDESIKYLLSYGYDFNNSFSSTVQDFKGKTDSDYKEAKNSIHASAYDNYYSARIRVDTSATTLKVGKVTFDVWTINLYDENAKAYAHQEMYTAVINDYFFSAVVSYDDEFYRNKMVTTITKAKFK